MSDYCTNCKWLSKATNGGRTDWLCFSNLGRNGVTWDLTSLCGNPAKRNTCKIGNWYELKVKQQEKKMTTEEQIKVMQAYVDGKQIEISSDPSKGWSPAGNNFTPSWNWELYVWRIKPEPKQIIIKESEFEEIISIAKTLIARIENNKKE